MTCIKTGAVVYFENYAANVRADIYKVGTTYVIRTNNRTVSEAEFFGAAQFGDRDPKATYTVTAAPSEKFWRPDIGVFVLPDTRVINHG